MNNGYLASGVYQLDNHYVVGSGVGRHSASARSALRRRANNNAQGKPCCLLKNHIAMSSYYYYSDHVNIVDKNTGDKNTVDNENNTCSDFSSVYINKTMNCDNSLCIFREGTEAGQVIDSNACSFYPISFFNQNTEHPVGFCKNKKIIDSNWTTCTTYLIKKQDAPLHIGFFHSAFVLYLTYDNATDNPIDPNNKTLWWTFSMLEAVQSSYAALKSAVSFWFPVSENKNIPPDIPRASLYCGKLTPDNTDSSNNDPTYCGYTKLDGSFIVLMTDDRLIMRHEGVCVILLFYNDNGKQEYNIL